MNLISGNSPQERAISTLIHDSNSGLCLSYIWIESVRKHIENSEIQKALEALDFAKSSNKRIKDCIDNYLTKAQNDFQ